MMPPIFEIQAVKELVFHNILQRVIGGQLGCRRASAVVIKPVQGQCAATA
jgi:hypothetical protein